MIAWFEVGSSHLHSCLARALSESSVNLVVLDSLRYYRVVDHSGTPRLASLFCDGGEEDIVYAVLEFVRTAEKVERVTLQLIIRG